MNDYDHTVPRHNEHTAEQRRQLQALFDRFAREDLQAAQAARHVRTRPLAPVAGQNLPAKPKRHEH